jgi:alanine racemase
LTRLIRAVISGAALRANLACIRRRAPRSKIMAVVKANAYGHGLVPTALALQDADAFAVARIDEAVALRAAGVAQPIVLLEGVINAGQLAEAAQLNLDLVVHDPLQIELLEGQSLAHRFVLWLKVDTGMNRLGFRVEEFPAVLERLQALGMRAQEIRVLTHLARADERDSTMTREQIEKFRALTQGLHLATSIANSAGIFSQPVSHGDWVRPGLALYGASPFPGETAVGLGLIPAMNLETTVISTRRVPAGESVGYGGTWVAPRDSLIAILAGGYGDGLPRQLPIGTPVLVAGSRLPLVGRVSMDMIAVDASSMPSLHVGAVAQLWGADLPVEEIATLAGTIPYELLCAVSQRVPLMLR